MLACLRNLLQAVPHTFFLVEVRYRNGRHSDNTIHWSTDVVGHIGEEVGFCPAGCFSRIIGLLQCHLLLTFLLDQVIYVSGTHHNGQFAVFVMYECHSHLKIDDTIVCQFLISQRIVLSVCPYIIKGQFFQKFFAAFLREMFLCITVQPLRPAIIVSAEILCYSPAFVFLGTVRGDRIPFRIHKKN